MLHTKLGNSDTLRSKFTFGWRNFWNSKSILIDLLCYSNIVHLWCFQDERGLSEGVDRITSFDVGSCRFWVSYTLCLHAFGALPVLLRLPLRSPYLPCETPVLQCFHYTMSVLSTLGKDLFTMDMDGRVTFLHPILTLWWFIDGDSGPILSRWMY